MVTEQIIFQSPTGIKGGRARASPAHAPPPPVEDGGDMNPLPALEGYREAVKDAFKEQEKSEKKLDQIVDRSRKALLVISAIFPFDFFPDKVIVDVEKVSIIKRIFFWSERVQSVAIKDIADTFVDTSLLFATLRIVDRFYYENNVKVEYLFKKEAKQARRLIEGLVLANREQVDLSKLPQDSIKERMLDLGGIRDKRAD